MAAAKFTGRVFLPVIVGVYLRFSCLGLVFFLSHIRHAPVMSLSHYVSGQLVRIHCA